MYSLQRLPYSLPYSLPNFLPYSLPYSLSIPFWRGMLCSLVTMRRDRMDRPNDVLRRICVRCQQSMVFTMSVQRYTVPCAFTIALPYALSSITIPYPFPCLLAYTLSYALPFTCPVEFPPCHWSSSDLLGSSHRYRRLLNA